MTKLLKSLLTILAGGLICVSLLSCENFLKATEVREEIEKVIAYNNAKAYTIKIVADKGSGSIIKPIGGEVSKKATDSFTVSFEPAEDYTFVRWEAYSDSLPSGASIKEYVNIEDPLSLETKITFLKELDSITIYANCPRIPFTKVFIDGNNGLISPTRNFYNVNMNAENYISFTPSDEYEFIRWQVYDETTATPIENGLYLQIDDTSAKSTNYKLVNIPADQDIQLSVKPVVIDRPRVIIRSPEYDPTQGAYRDSRIVVIFNKSMDPASIYYVENETTQEITEIKQKNNIDDNKLLWVDLGKGGQSDKHCYGYIKNDGDIVFKNISIKNGKNDQENMLKYFENPRFETPTRLSIFPRKDEDTNEFILPNPGTSFIVNIENEFSYIYENQSIKLKETETWPYYVGYKTDDAPPFKSDLEIVDVDGNLIKTSSSDPTYLNASKKLKIRVAVNDTQSGPLEYFDLFLKGTTIAGVTVDKTISLEYDFTEGQYAYCGNAYETTPETKTYTEYTLNDIPDGDGDYNFILKFYDNVGKSVESDRYYISVDMTPIPAENITQRAITAETNSISYTYECTDSDFKSGMLFYRKLSDVTSGNEDDWSNANSIELPKSNSKKTVKITGLDSGTTYELKAVFYDKAKNPTSFLYKKDTQYKPNTIVSSAVDEASRTIKITLNDEPDPVNNLKLYYKKNTGSAFTELSYDPANEKAFIIRKIDYAKTYTFYLLNQSYEEIPEVYDNATSQGITTSSQTAEETQKTKPAPAEFAAYRVDDGLELYFSDFGSNYNNYTHIQYKLYKYDKEGTSKELKKTSDKLSLNDLSYIPSQSPYHFLELKNFDYGSHYLIKILTYYNDTPCEDKDIQCLELHSKIYNFTCTSVTANTATLSWTKPTENFYNYKVEWYKSGTIISNTILNKNDTSIVLTNLPQNSELSAKITYITKTGESLPVYVNFTTEHFEDFSDDNMIKGIHFLRETPLVMGICFNYLGDPKTLHVKYGTTCKNLNNSFTQSPEDYQNSIAGYRGGKFPFIFTPADPGSPKVYYMQFFDPQDKPVSEIIALRYYRDNINILDSINYTTTYDVSSNKPSITINWVPSQYYGKVGTVFAIQIKPADESEWPPINAYNSIRITSINQTTCVLDHVSKMNANGSYDSLVAGEEYDIRFLTAQTDEAPYVSYCIKIKNNVNSITGAYASYIGYDNVILEWNPTECQYYNVYMRDGNLDVPLVDKIPQNEQSVQIFGLKPNMGYGFVISTCTNEGEKKPESPLTISTKKKAIYDVTVDTVTETTAKINWKRISDCTYKVEYKKSSESNYNIWNENIPNTSNIPVEITGLDPSTNYDIRIKAYYNASDIEIENVYLTTAANPANFIGKGTTSSSIRLQWSMPQGNYSKIILSYTTSEFDYPVNILEIKSGDSNNYTLNNLLPGTVYNFTLTTYADEAMTNANVKTLSVTTTQ